MSLRSFLETVGSPNHAIADGDVHVYGVAGSGPVDLDVAVHTGTGDAYRDGWFVVFQPDEPAGTDSNRDEGPIALVSLETEPRVWDGFWTADPDRAAEIAAFVDAEL